MVFCAQAAGCSMYFVAPVDEQDQKDFEQYLKENEQDHEDFIDPQSGKPGKNLKRQGKSLFTILNYNITLFSSKKFMSR